MKFQKMNYMLTLLCTAGLLLQHQEGIHAFVVTSNNQVSLPTASSSTMSSRLFLASRVNRTPLEQKTPDYLEVASLLENYGEQSRKFRRSYFSSADWVRSRRPGKFFDNIKSTTTSAILRQLRPEITFFALTSYFVVLWNTYFAKQSFKLILPQTPASLAIAALGLLLTFRTNSAYARWNEARTAWGKVINDSRSLARMGCIWSKTYNKNMDNEKLKHFSEAICVFSRTLMNRTLPPQEDEEAFRKYCRQNISNTQFCEYLIHEAEHRPTVALSELTSIVSSFNLNPLHQIQIEDKISGLCDALGANERIFTSPVPRFYTRHTERSLAFWLLSLPAALYEPFKAVSHPWGVIPATCMIAAFLLGIEELANQMEEPFSILPMDKMCGTSIRVPVMEQLRRTISGDKYGKGQESKQKTSPPAATVTAVTKTPVVDVVDVFDIDDAAHSTPSIKSTLPTPDHHTVPSPVIINADHHVPAHAVKGFNTTLPSL